MSSVIAADKGRKTLLENKPLLTLFFFFFVAVCMTLLQARDDAGAKAGQNSDPVLVGAGDIASCDDLAGAYATAKLIEKIPGTVFAAGDLAYPSGSDEEFANCYGPTWGRFKDRTRPAPGNHEYNSGGASGYVKYFGDAAGDPKKGYYSYDLGQWHILALNSECLQGGVATLCLPRESGCRRT